MAKRDKFLYQGTHKCDNDLMSGSQVGYLFAYHYMEPGSIDIILKKL